MLIYSQLLPELLESDKYFVFHKEIFMPTHCPENMVVSKVSDQAAFGGKETVRPRPSRWTESSSLSQSIGSSRSGGCLFLCYWDTATSI